MSSSSVNQPQATSGTLFQRRLVAGRYIHCPPHSVLDRVGQEFYLTCCTGKSYHVLDVHKLRKAFQGPCFAHSINCIDVFQERVYLGIHCTMYIYYKRDCMHTCLGHEEPIDGIVILSDTVAISYNSHELFLWQDATFKRMPPLPDAALITHVMHPNTYLNKVLVATEKGTLHLLNIQTKQWIYSFQRPVPQSSLSSSQTISSSVLCIAKCHDPDVVAIGTQQGKIDILELKQDEILLEFFHSQNQGAVQALAFLDIQNVHLSNSETQSLSLLASGAQNGDLLIWNLLNGQLHQVVYRAHRQSIHTIHTLSNPPRLITTGEDNAILMWIFDQPDGLCREYKSRRGHIGPIHILKTYDDEGIQFLSCSNTNEAGFVGRTSLVKPHQNCIFSQASLRKHTKQWSFSFSELPPITSMAFTSSRHYDWPNILTCHKDTHEVFIWSAKSKSLVSNYLSLEPKTNDTATAVAISACGNYGIVGYQSGAMHLYNLQSGIHRGSFMKSKIHTAHASKINCIATSSFSIVLSTSSDTLDLQLHVWDLLKRSHSGSIALTSQFPNDSIRFFISMGILSAVALTSGTVVVCDVPGRLAVREFNTRAMPSAMAFSLDGRLLSIACTDNTLMTFDMLSSSLVDWIEFASPVLDIAFDKSGTSVTLSHQNGEISVWASQHIFDVNLSKSLNSIPTKPIYVDELLQPEKSNEAEKELHTTSEHAQQYTSSVNQLEPGLITLSGLSIEKLESILFLEEIKQKGKPIQQPEPLPVTPFFLPSSSDLNFLPHGNVLEKVESSSRSDSATQKNFSRNPRIDLLQQMLLKDVPDEEKFNDIIEFFSNASASAVHSLLGSIGPAAGGTEEEILVMLRCFLYLVKRRDFADLVQCLLQVFLQIHGDDVKAASSDSPIVQKAQDLLRLIQRDWTELNSTFEKTTCFLKYLSSVQME